MVDLPEAAGPSIAIMEGGLFFDTHFTKNHYFLYLFLYSCFKKQKENLSCPIFRPFKFVVKVLRCTGIRIDEEIIPHPHDNRFCVIEQIAEHRPLDPVINR